MSDNEMQELKNAIVNLTHQIQRMSEKQDEMQLGDVPSKIKGSDIQSRPRIVCSHSRLLSNGRQENMSKELHGSLGSSFISPCVSKSNLYDLL